MHARTQIRNAVVTAVSGLTTTGANVFKSRSIPLSEADLPALCVYARLDTPNYAGGTMEARPQRVIELHIEGHIVGDDEDLLDTIAEEVETAIYANAALLGMVGGVALGDQAMRVDGEGAELAGLIDMTFHISYSTTEGAPGTVLRG